VQEDQGLNMMELVPTLIGGGVVLDAANICSHHSTDCRSCPEQAVGVHNWLLNTGIRYCLIDFQDEKDVCPTILIELLQLRKRMKIPFVFVGLMDRPKMVLTSYAYSGYPFFAAPEEAVLHLRQMHSELFHINFSKVLFGDPIPNSRTRHQRVANLDLLTNEIAGS
jgi:hypothetical protein